MVFWGARWSRVVSVLAFRAAGPDRGRVPRDPAGDRCGSSAFAGPGLGPALDVRGARARPAPASGREKWERNKDARDARPGPLGGPPGAAGRHGPSSNPVDAGPAASYSPGMRTALSRSAASRPRRRPPSAPRVFPGAARSSRSSLRPLPEVPRVTPCPVADGPAADARASLPEPSTRPSTGSPAPSSRRRPRRWARAPRPAARHDRRPLAPPGGVCRPPTRPDGLTSAHWLSLFACWSAAHPAPGAGGRGPRRARRPAVDPRPRARSEGRPALGPVSTRAASLAHGVLGGQLGGAVGEGERLGQRLPQRPGARPPGQRAAQRGRGPVDVVDVPVRPPGSPARPADGEPARARRPRRRAFRRRAGPRRARRRAGPPTAAAVRAPVTEPRTCSLASGRSSRSATAPGRTAGRHHRLVDQWLQVRGVEDDGVLDHPVRRRPAPGPAGRRRCRRAPRPAGRRRSAAPRAAPCGPGRRAGRAGRSRRPRRRARRRPSPAGAAGRGPRARRAPVRTVPVTPCRPGAAAGRGARPSSTGWVASHQRR